MDGLYQNFYRNFYRKTNGFIPVAPIGRAVFPGDFFQISNGYMVVLGNIFRGGVIDPLEVDISDQDKLNPAEWNFSDGVTKPYSGRGSGHSPLAGEFEFSKQVLAFKEKGSFMFKATAPKSVRIRNWNDFQQALIIRLTQTLYSFRKVYVVTEVVTAEEWTLAISGGAQAELEIATDQENFGLVDIFGHSSARTIQSKEIECYLQEKNRRPCFFKTKKLVLREEQTEVSVSSLIAQQQDQNEWAQQFYGFDFLKEPLYYNRHLEHTQFNLLDLLPANELNANTALRYFKWIDANMDDIEKLFINNGE